MMKSAVALVCRSLKQSQAPAASLYLQSASAAPAVRVLSTSAVTHDDRHHHHECEKMVSEGGGSKISFHEKKEEVDSKKIGVSDANQPSKNEWQQTKDSVSEVTDRTKSGLEETKESVTEKASDMGDAAKDKAQQVKESDKAGEGKSVAGKITDQAKKEINTSSDMVKDMPQKVAETTQGLKEVGVEAGKAVKRDVSHAAEKVGLKTSS